MYLLNRETGKTESLQDIKHAWNIFRAQDSANHADVFPRELYTIIMDSVNGRNDYSVIGFTCAELSAFIRSLREKF